LIVNSKNKKLSTMTLGLYELGNKKLGFNFDNEHSVITNLDYNEHLVIKTRF